MCEDSWRWQSQNPNGYPDSENTPEYNKCIEIK